jgi:hypothetical protein
MEPSQAIAVIEVSPASGGDVIAEWRGPATFRTSEGGVASMGEPDVDVVLLHVERDALDPPGILQGQEF